MRLLRISNFDLLQQIANLLLSTSLFSIFVKLLVRFSVQYTRNFDRMKRTPFVYIRCVMCGERKISKCVSVSSHALSNRTDCRRLSSRYTHVMCCRSRNRPRDTSEQRVCIDRVRSHNLFISFLRLVRAARCVSCYSVT